MKLSKQFFINKLLLTMKEFKKTAYHHYGNRFSSILKFIYYSLFKINTFVVVQFNLNKQIPEYPLDSDFVVVKPSLTELENYRTGIDLPREFYYDKIHSVKTCYLALFNGELAYIHWIYLKGDYNRFLNLRDKVAELNYNTTIRKFRRRGLMGKMLVYILNDLKEQGFKKAVGLINAENGPALKNTFKAGFEEVSRIKTLGPFNRKYQI